MEEEQKPKPVKEKKKRSQGPKKERKPKGPRAQQQQPGLGPGMAAQFFSQSQHQQLHQQEGLVLGDTHASFTGRLAAQHLGVPPASLPFTTTHHAGMVSTSSSPSPPVRVHTTLPPKKSISPSRMAAFTDPQGIPASFQSQEAPSTTTSSLAAQLAMKPPQVINIAHLEEHEQGGLLRQQLLQRVTLPSDSLGLPERKFSPYQPVVSLGDGGRDQQSPQASSIRYGIQRDEVGRVRPPPNVQLPTFGSKTETGRILGGHHSRALGLEEKVRPPQHMGESGVGPGKVQLQRIVIPATREEVRRTVSPVKREPQPAHMGEHTAYQVSTIRRTPSPAHLSGERRSPAPLAGWMQEHVEKPQPVNLSIPELHKKQGSGSPAGGPGSLPGSVLSTLYAMQQSRTKSGPQSHMVYHPATTEQQTYTTKAPDLSFSGMSRGDSGSISIPSQILSTAQSGGLLQNEILRQTLLQGITAAQMHGANVNPGVTMAHPGGRTSREEPKAHDQGPIMYKFEPDGSRKTVSPTPQSRGAGRHGPSPHHPHHEPALRGVDTKHENPGPGTTAFAMSMPQSIFSTVSQQQQPMRYTIQPSITSPKLTTTSQIGLPAEGFRQKVPSPKPQHRHKEKLAALHQTYAAKGTHAHTAIASSALPSHPSSTASSPHAPSVSSFLPAFVPTSINVSPSAGPIHQPVVSLVRLPDSGPKYEKKAVPPYSVIQIPTETTSSRIEASHPGKSYFADVFLSGPSQQHQPPKAPQPHHINPFTFPSKAPAKILPYHLSAAHKDEPPKVTLARNTLSPLELRVADASEEMPRLLPISPFKSRDDDRKSLEVRKTHQEELSKIPNPFNMRLQNLANLPMSSIYRSTYRAHSVAMQRAKSGCIVSAAKSLDLLRQNLQRFINKEIDAIIQQYIEKFFKPGIENIKENSGSNAVSEEHIQAVCRQVLEEAKKMYHSEGRRSVTPTRDMADNDSETGSTGSRKNPFTRKRKPSDTDSEKSQAVPKRKKGRPPLYYVSGRSTPSKLKNNEPVRREGPKWDQDRINLHTLCIMGARANKALGLGATRGRIYIKHPDLFKYSGDQDDKQWLYENHHMPATGGKAYMLLLEDVKELAEDAEYRNNGNQLPQELVGFTIPDWMAEKVKVQMVAGRTDYSKKPPRSRSTTPIEIRASVMQDDDGESEGLKSLPFSSFSDRKDKDGIPVSYYTSPSGEAEMEFLSGANNDDTAFTRISPFTLTGGFDDPSPSPSDLDTLEDETPLSAPFDLAN